MLGLFVVAALLGCIPGAIAQGKGRSFGLWWVYGFLIFPVALVHILLEPDGRQEAAAFQAMVHAAGHRACPSCAEPIKRAALVCRYCGRDVPPEPAPAAPPPRDARRRPGSNARPQPHSFD